MIETYVTTDEHYGHPKVIDSCDRPAASIDEHDAMLVDRFNSTVTHTNALTFHLGDTILGTNRLERIRDILAALNGNHVLVPGNHCKPFAGSLGGWKHVRDYIEAGFDSVVAYTPFKLPQTSPERPGRVVMFSHFPYDGDSRPGEERHVAARLRDEGIPIVHGHIHTAGKITRSRRGTLQVNAGVDVWNYAPVSVKTLAALMDDELGTDVGSSGLY